MLNELQIAEFRLKGFLHIREAFNPAVARQCASFVLEQIADPDLDMDRQHGYVHIKETFWHCRGHNYSDQVRVICNSRCVMKRRMNLKWPQNVVERSIAEAMLERAS